MSKVSIIIPTYNCANYLSSAINSILTQTYEDYEIIVVDDGSIDNTQTILKSYSDNRLKYFYKENGGISSARNLAMNRVSGEYVAFLDADDIWCPTKLEDQISLLNEHKEIGIVSCNFQYINQNNEDMGFFNMKSLYPQNGFNLYELINNAVLIPSTVVMRKTVIDDIGFFNTEYDGAEDFEYFLRILKKYHLIVANKVLLKYRIAHSSSNKGRRYYNAREKVLNDFLKLELEGSDDKLRVAVTEAYYRLYYNSGKDLMWYGETTEAREYFKKALIYRTTSNILWLYVKSYLKEMLIYFNFLKRFDKEK